MVTNMQHFVAHSISSRRRGGRGGHASAIGGRRIAKNDVSRQLGFRSQFQMDVKKPNYGLIYLMYWNDENWSPYNKDQQ